jgi:uncharacterized RDD family membrane protein YckC
MGLPWQHATADRVLMPDSTTGSVHDYPGERFGLPRDGVSSVAGLGRRLAALTIDWLLGYLVALLFVGVDPLGTPGFSWIVLGVWFLLTAAPVAVFGASVGMTAMGIRVASIDSAVVIGVPRAVLRTALIAVVVPAVIRDDDGRGWHDRSTRTIVVRSRA